MKQIYYAIQSTLHGRGSNVTKVISLSLGLTIGVLLFSQIAFELNYEKCYPDADRLVLVRGGGENVKTGEKGEGYDDSLFAPMAEAFRSDLSQWIENATVIFNFETLNVFKDGHKLKDVNYAYVDTCYFRTFGIKVLKGNPEELQRAGSIFVSETFVRDVFGGQDPVGQKLSLDKQHELTVRGVYQDTPENTAYHFDFVAPIYAGGGYIGGGTWGRNDIYYIILRLRDGVDREEINRQIYKAMQKYYPDSADDEWRNFYDAQPLPEIHLDDSNTRTRLYIYGFLGFAIFFVAIMNYVLVAIATMSRRAKSIGVHKCSGASAINIFSMFLFETGICGIDVRYSGPLYYFQYQRSDRRFTFGAVVLTLYIGNFMGSDAHCFCTVHSSRSAAGKIVFTHSCHSSFSSLHRWEKGVEAFSFICTIYGGIFCDGDFVSIFDAVSSSD